MEMIHNFTDVVICGRILLQKTDWEISFICNFCEESLSTLPELLQHVLSEHVENATQDTLEKLCGAKAQEEVHIATETNQNDYVEPDDYDMIIQDVLDHQEREDMDDLILQHFMNKTSKSNNKEDLNETIEIEDDDNDAEENEEEDNIEDDSFQSNAKFEFLDVSESKNDNTDFQPIPILPNRVCKITTMLQCEHCNAKFQYNSQLVNHKAKEHGISPYICTECGKVFRDKRCLLNHEMRHKGIKPHACTMCDKTFTTRTERIMHMRRHTDDRPYKCTHCDKRFISKGAMTIHRRMHTKERPHLCSNCGMKFSSKSGLNKHVLLHSSERPYKCTICPASFKGRDGLRQHMLIHSDIKKYACQLCDKTFAQQAGVYSHMKSTHKNVYKNENKEKS